MAVMSKDQLWVSLENETPQRTTDEVKTDTLQGEEKEGSLVVKIEHSVVTEQKTASDLATEGNKAITSNEVDTKALVVTEPGDFHLDHAEPLPPESFPNSPTTESGSITTTIPNVMFLLERYGIVARYNVIKKASYFLVPGLVSTPDNVDSVAMSHIKSLARLNRMSVNGLEDIVLAIADRNQYNPVANWIGSKPWDGVDRLPEFCDTLSVEEDFPRILRDILIKKWMLSAVAAVLKAEGFRSRGVLTLQGRQSMGKTSWIASLVTDVALRESVIKLDHHMDAGDKDSKIAAATHWIVEIGELESSFKRDVARLKGFITSDFDKIRLPYARSASNFPRKTVFCATVNDDRFLVDATGNTRWWVVPVSDINYQHNMDMQQIWAQIAVDFENGKQWWLTAEEEDFLEQCNADHRIVSVIEERVMPILDMSLKNQDGLPAMTATELLEYVGYKTVNNQQARECGALLRQHLGSPKKINGYQKWRIPLVDKPDVTNISRY